MRSIEKKSFKGAVAFLLVVLMLFTMPKALSFMVEKLLLQFLRIMKKTF